MDRSLKGAPEMVKDTIGKEALIMTVVADGAPPIHDRPQSTKPRD